MSKNPVKDETIKDINPGYAASASDAAYSVSVKDGDLQDSVAGSRFDITLTALVTDQAGKPAKSGQVIFSVDAQTRGEAASAAFASNAPCPVTNGLATASTLTAGSVLSGVTGDYGTAVVKATIVNSSTSSGVALYLERVWRRDSAVITIQSGDGQTTRTKTQFAQPLVVQITDSKGAPVKQALVTIELSTTSPANFVVNDSDKNVVQVLSPKTVMVRADDQGIATSPKILALSTEGTVDGAVQFNAASKFAFFHLTVSNTVEVIYTLKSLLDPDSLDMAPGGKQWVQYKLIDGNNNAVPGKDVLLTIVNNQTKVASFSSTALVETLTKTTDGSGIAQAPVYASSTRGTASLVASMVSKEAEPHLTPISVG